VTVLAVAAFVWAFVTARQAVLWVFIALFLAIVLQTPVTWLEERVGMRRGNAAMIVVLGVMGFLAVLSYLLVSPFVGAVRNLIEDLPNIVERIRASDLFQQIDQRTDLGDKLQSGPRRSRRTCRRRSATPSPSAARSSASVSAP
jgi:predicted PurR-regulated permease PerM